jgi:hypothetical protein
VYALALTFEQLDHPVHAFLGGWIKRTHAKHLVASAGILIVSRCCMKGACLTNEFGT